LKSTTTYEEGRVRFGRDDASVEAVEHAADNGNIAGQFDRVPGFAIVRDNVDSLGVDAWNGLAEKLSVFLITELNNTIETLCTAVEDSI
jgi:hypothetical protein